MNTLQVNQPITTEPPCTATIGHTPEKKPGIFKNLKNASKTFFKWDSPKKQDSVSFVSENFTGQSAYCHRTALYSYNRPHAGEKARHLQES